MAESLPDPSSFPGGEDSYHQFIRVDGPAGSGDLPPAEGGRAFGVPCSLNSERVDFLDSAGDLDPVIALRNAYPELTSIITSPQSWMKDPLPSAKDIRVYLRRVLVLSHSKNLMSLFAYGSRPPDLPN